MSYVLFIEFVLIFSLVYRWKKGHSDRVERLTQKVKSLLDRVESLTDRVESLTQQVKSLTDRVESLTEQSRKESEEVTYSPYYTLPHPIKYEIVFNPKPIQREESLSESSSDKEELSKEEEEELANEVSRMLEELEAKYEGT